MKTSPGADSKDQNDTAIASWGRSRHEGYRKFNHGFVQPAPLFFTQDHHPLWLGDIYRGCSAFLIASGPSFLALPREPLLHPGILTMGLNNSVKTFRPNLWCSVDSPDHWVRSLWFDPTITKFVPISHAGKKVFNSDEWKFTDKLVGDCPNVVYYKRNEHFKAKQFLWEDCFNWGNHKDHGGGRSVMLPAIRILFTLGVRRIYLLGCDFSMSQESKYHFEQDRNQGSLKGNNETYKKLDGWFRELRPLFEREGLHVFNCNKASGLKAFDHMPYEAAVAEAMEQMDGVDLAAERTLGLYDTKTKEKQAGVGK